MNRRRGTAAAHAAVHRINALAQRLAKARGERWTQQRSAIIAVLAQADAHLRADEIWRRVRHDDPTIGQATVYRTLGLLIELGLVAQPQIGGSSAVFELAVDRRRHHHLVDADTGMIHEFHDQELDRLLRRIARGLGCDLVGHEVVLHGRRRVRRSTGARPARAGVVADAPARGDGQADDGRR